MNFASESAAPEETRLVDLVALVDAVADDEQRLGHEVVVSSPERLPYRCRPTSLRRAVLNLGGTHDPERVQGAEQAGQQADQGAAERLPREQEVKPRRQGTQRSRAGVTCSSWVMARGLCDAM